MNKEKVRAAIIEGYRDAIFHRYQYNALSENYELPASVTEDTVDQLRAYFLTYMYPPYAKRAELNEAFNSLDEFTRHPQKLGRILLDATKLIFRYGLYLPKILQAGLRAMRTFTAAMTFENRLLEEAIKNKIIAPYDADKMQQLISFLKREDIDHFITSSQTLFTVIHDKVLMKKIKAVIKHIITVMRTKEKLYTNIQVKGLELGLKMIVEGDALFNQLDTEAQNKLVMLVTQIEQDHLDQVFHNNND